MKMYVLVYSSRFSVGFYTNPKRSQATSEVRSLIGRGVRLYLLGGECYAENLCNVPVFIQSISANLKNNFPMNTVSKLPPNGTMKLFDMYQFSKQLALAAERTYNGEPNSTVTCPTNFLISRCPLSQPNVHYPYVICQRMGRSISSEVGDSFSSLGSNSTKQSNAVD